MNVGGKFTNVKCVAGVAALRTTNAPGRCREVQNGCSPIFLCGERVIAVCGLMARGCCTNH